VIQCDALAPPPGGFNSEAPWISGLIHDGQGQSVPVLTLDPKGVLTVDAA